MDTIKNQYYIRCYVILKTDIVLPQIVSFKTAKTLKEALDVFNKMRQDIYNHEDFQDYSYHNGVHYEFDGYTIQIHLGNGRVCIRSVYDDVGSGVDPSSQYSSKCFPCTGIDEWRLKKNLNKDLN